MRSYHFLFLAIAVILSLSMIFSCSKQEEAQKPDPPPTPTPKETVVIDQGVDTKPIIKQEGGEAKVSFTATETWTASIINTKADSWISLDKTSGSAGSVTITITVQGNDNPDDRSATVRIKAGNTTIDIVVSQKGKDSLTTTASKNEFGPEGGELTIEVKANIDFSYSIAEGCKDWISESGTKALTTTTLTFKIAENEDVKKREGSVTVKSSLGEEVMKVYQSGTDPTIVITQNEYSVEAKGETIQVEVSSNVNVEMAIPDDCDWIKEEKTKAISTNTFYLNVLENTNLDSRAAKVVFKNVENGLAEEVTVNQTGREDIQVESISLDKNELSLTEGDKVPLVATVLPENADNKNIIWSSSNEEFAIVEDGVVTALKEGESTITAKTEDGGKTATCSVTVNSKVISVESVSLDKTTAEITEGEAITLTATIKPESATNKNVIWSSSNAEIATVEDGVVTAIKEGEATITAKTEDGEKTATCSVKVNAKVYPVESISLDKTSVDLTKSETATITATVKPDNASNKKVIWSSSNEEVATVKDGVVTAIKAGEATITAKTEDGEKTATCSVKVNAMDHPVESVELNKTSASLKVGETTTLTATVKPDNASDKTVTWSSSDASVASVENGIVTAKKIGTATITAKAGGKTATCTISAYQPQTEEDKVAFEDANFKAYCVQNFDTDGDGEISEDEAEAISTIDCSKTSFSATIVSLKGIEHFLNLVSLDFSGQSVVRLDISQNASLSNLICGGNQLIQLDVSGNDSLSLLDCSPMNDNSGNNTLRYVIVNSTQSLEGITINRSKDNIPDETQIIMKGQGGDNEDYREGGEG